MAAAGAWNARSKAARRKLRKITPNHHYNAECLEPWGGVALRGYGLEAIERFIREVATVEFGGPSTECGERLSKSPETLGYNDLSADRQTIAAVQAMEPSSASHAAGKPDAVVQVNHPAGGLVLFTPGSSEGEVLFADRV